MKIPHPFSLSTSVCPNFVSFTNFHLSLISQKAPFTPSLDILTNTKYICAKIVSSCKMHNCSFYIGHFDMAVDEKEFIVQQTYPNHGPSCDELALKPALPKDGVFHGCDQAFCQSAPFHALTPPPKPSPLLFNTLSLFLTTISGLSCASCCTRVVLSDVDLAASQLEMATMAPHEISNCMIRMKEKKLFITRNYDVQLNCLTTLEIEKEE